jgi:hypothetical protein
MNQDVPIWGPQPALSRPGGAYRRLEDRAEHHAGIENPIDVKRSGRSSPMDVADAGATPPRLEQEYSHTRTRARDVLALAV